MSKGKLALLAAGALIIVVLGAVLVFAGSPDQLTVYSARSHYGEEAVLKDFEKRSGEGMTLFGGSASELYERIRAEGDETKADVLVTVDAANLWRADQEGLLEPVDLPAAEGTVPENARDPEGAWYGLTARARTIMRSTERVGAEDLADYEDLGDPRWRGKLCLRSGTSEYNVSFVADRLAKDGEEETRAMLEAWMANEPEILGSDVDVLEAIAAGRCDVGLTNTYYLGRELADDPEFPVAPVWADQDARGTHVNLSGIGLVKGARHRAAAVELITFLTEPGQQAALIENSYEFGIREDVPTSPVIEPFGDFKRDPIDVSGAGERLDEALTLMSDLGWN